MSPKGSDRGSDDGLDPLSQNIVYETIVTSPARLDFVASAHETGKDINVNGKILAALEGLQDRLGRLEVSQIKRDEEECMKGAIKTGIFGSALGRRFDASRMRVDALYQTPPRRVQVRESPTQPYLANPLRSGMRTAR